MLCPRGCMQQDKVMAHRFLRGNTTILNKVKEPVQRHRNLLVLDLEATCEKGLKLDPQEIIELPCVALCTSTWQVKDVFHEYVKPRVHPVLTPFCTDLTGIMQETVADQPYFPEAFIDLQDWLSDRGCSEDPDESAFVTCGDWDLRVMLPSQCALDSVTIPDCFKRWINLKKSFSEATGYYPRSLGDMLNRLGLPLQGKLHSGIDDVYNMTRVIQCLATKHQAIFKITSEFEV